MKNEFKRKALNFLKKYEKSKWMLFFPIALVLRNHIRKVTSCDKG